MKKQLSVMTFVAVLVYSSIGVAKISDAELVQLFEQWNNALQTGKPETVAALYDEEGVLLPTVSDKVKFGRDEIANYFVKFLQMKPKGKIVKRFTRTIGDNAGVDSGIYEFELTKDGKVDHVLARYTYLYKKKDGKWLIAVHHSSVLPNATEEKDVPEVKDEYGI